MNDEQYKKWIRDAQVRRVIRWETVDNFYPRFFGCVVGLIAGLVMDYYGGVVIGLMAAVICYIIVRGSLEDEWHDN